MNEDLLHYIWRTQQFNHNDLRLTNGEVIQVLQAGTHNHDSGPDFFNALILQGEIKWAGNIEIHIKSEDWLLHKHQENPVYNKIILHVVWEDNHPISFLDGKPIPTLELKGRVNKQIIDRFELLDTNTSWVACENYLSKIRDEVKQETISDAVVERLEQKSNRLDQILNLTKNDWEASLYQLLAKYFGFKVNSIPFELLASSLSYSILRKHQHNRKQLSALVWGQAGFLEREHKGSYPIELKEEYLFLKNKYQLKSIDPSLWKFMRMRPSNFPTVRIAQFIDLLYKNHNLFQKIIEFEELTQLYSVFQLEAGSYWESHYRFDIPATKKVKRRWVSFPLIS